MSKRVLIRRRGAPRSPAMLRPGYLAALAGCKALVLGAFGWLELHSSRRIVETTLEEGAVSLVQAVARAWLLYTSPSPRAKRHERMGSSG